MDCKYVHATFKEKHCTTCTALEGKGKWAWAYVIFCDGHTDLKIDDHVSPMKYLRIYQKNEEKQQK